MEGFGMGASVLDVGCRVEEWRAKGTGAEGRV
jgi:hypothetical protein